MAATRKKKRILLIGVPLGIALIAVVAGLWIRNARQDAIALYKASEAGNIAEVQRLVDRGVSPSAAHRVLAVPDAGVKPVVKQVALLAAASEGHTDVVRLLLDRGADIEAANEWDQTALACAARKSRIETVELLIQRGANIDVADERGVTPLMWAAKLGSPEMVALLLQHGARDGIDSRGRDAMGHARYRNEPQKAQIEALLGGSDPQTQANESPGPP